MKNFYVCLLTIFLSCFFASLIQSSFGSVNIQTVKIPTQNGQWVVADLYKPSSASKDSPAPVVIIIPGFQRSKETLSNIAIELSRRGIVSISIDPYAQGNSSSSMSTKAATSEGYGMFAIVDFIYETNILNYIDKKKIGATGHSAGGLAAMRGAQYFGGQVKNSKNKSKLHSAFISGMIRMGFKSKDIKKINSNIGVSYALYDEGAWQNKLGNGDMSIAPETIGLLKHQLNVKDSVIEKIEIDKYYGSIKDRTLMVVHNEKVLHPLQPYMKEAMSNQISFFQKVFKMEDTLSPNNQIWQWKELFTFISLIFSFFLILPIARVALSTPYFKTIINPIPKAHPKPKGQDAHIFWISIFISTIVACFSFVPLSELSKILFVDASSRIQTWFFPQRMNNTVMLWAVLNGTLGLILFFIPKILLNKNFNLNQSKWGLKISSTQLMKTGLLALLIFFLYFLILNVLYYLFHVDYRLLFIGIRTFNPITILLIPMYVPFFFIFFFANSLRVNTIMRIETGSEFQNILFSSAVTASGLILILLIQYSSLSFTGTVFWEAGWLYVNLLFGIVPIMIVLPFFHRYFFNLTGSVYLGPMTMCLIFIMILLSNTVCYFPL